MKLKKIIASMSLLLAVSMLVSCGKGAGTSLSTGDGADVAGNKENLAHNVVTAYEATDMSKNPSKVKDRKDTLVIATDDFSEKFNPLYADSVYDQRVCDVLYRPLIFNDEEGEMTQSDLAELPEVSKDNLSYTFKLKDAKWDDGTPITAKDAAFSFKVICDGKYDGPLDLVTGKVKIKGGKDYQEGKTNKVSGIEVVDDKTLKITLEEPTSAALYQFSFVYPLQEAYYSKYYEQGTDKIKETFTKPGPASGPYKFVKYKPGQEVDLVGNDKCYLGAPKIKNVVFKVTPMDTRLSVVQAGDADVGMHMPINEDNIQDIQDVGFLGYQMYPENGYGYIGYNLEKPVLKEKSVREALTYGLDRKKITETVYGKYAKVINIPQAEASWTYSEPKNTYDFNLEKAKKILDDAGWKPGADGIREKDGQKLKLHFTGATGSKTSQAIIAVASENYKELGVEFTSEVIDFPTILEKVESGDIEAYCISWYLGADPNASEIFSSTGPYNYGKYNSTKTDDLYNKINKEMDTEKQKDLYKELYDILNEDLPYTYLNQSNELTVINGRVKNFKDSPYIPFTMHLHEVTLE